MPQSDSSPFGYTIASATAYSALLWSLTQRDSSFSATRLQIKAISACHSLIATCLTIVSLSQAWNLELYSITAESKSSINKANSNHRLDDMLNPLISGKNSLANFVTAWETGYLIYDTGALFLESSRGSKSRNLGSALSSAFRKSPVVVTHHVVLASALLWLQTYIAKKREKGVKVIMAFFLMNASTPLLHLRWYRKKATGKTDARIDVLLAALFAITRFGSVYWVISKYGQFHDLSAWEAIRRQRTICQTGTGLLTGLNVLWWVGLVTQMAKRR